MSRIRAAYQEMYLVTKNVYRKVLDCIDERSRQEMESLNAEEEEEDVRRPSEDFFDDVSYQDISGGVEQEEQHRDTRIQEVEHRRPEQIRQRSYYPAITYEPDLPPIREVLREPEQLNPIPTLTKSTYPRLYYQPSPRDKLLMSEIIRQGHDLPPIRQRQMPGPLPPPAARANPPVQQTVTPTRGRPPVRVSFQDEGVETIRDCMPGAPGVAKSICSQKTKSSRGGYQCELCNRILATKHNLNRHMMSVHKSVSSSPSSFYSGPSTSQESFSGWDREQEQQQEMETSALPTRRKRNIDPDYTTDEDVPLSKVYLARKKKSHKDPDPSGSGKKESFESWQ